MNCAIYKGYILKVGKYPIQTKANQIDIPTIVSETNCEEVTKLIDRLTKIN